MPDPLFQSFPHEGLLPRGACGELADGPHQPVTRARNIAALGLFLLITAVYFNSLRGEFVFDDVPAIVENPTIRALWPLSGPLSPPENSGVGGRPLANLSFALNHAIHGTHVVGYHVANVLLHLGSALLLFGIVHRTLRLHSGAEGIRASMKWALVTAACWSVHPLTTASVAYLSQRTELLMGFFYLAALYAFIRGATGGTRAWRVVSVTACVCGMMSKEVMVTAPVVILLYDRTFIAGTLKEAWRHRRVYYLALAATWLPLGYLLTTGLAQRSVGYGLGVSAASYALTEAAAILHYLRLAVLPHPLIFDYGPVYEWNLPAVLCVLAMVGVAGWAFVRGKTAGFLALCIFLLLAPTSSVVPVAEQPIAENRMYLPLAALIALGLLGVRAIVGRDVAWLGAAAIGGWPLIAGLSALTIVRNADYRSQITLWSDTVVKRPQNWRAQFNHGITLLDRNRPAEAATAFEHAIQLKPGEAKAHNSLGNALLELGRVPDAIARFTEAVRLQPTFARAWSGLGTALLRNGDAAGAVAILERSLQLDADSASTQQALGNAFFQLDQPAKAITHYAAALAIDPTLADAHYNAGSASLELGRVDEAILHLGAAVKLKPADAEIRNHLGAAFVRAGLVAEAVAEFEAALTLDPGYSEAHDNLAIARKELRRGR